MLFTKEKKLKRKIKNKEVEKILNASGITLHPLQERVKEFLKAIIRY